MANKIRLDENIYECLECGYQWGKEDELFDLDFDDEENCFCCSKCGRYIDDIDDNDYEDYED